MSNYPIGAPSWKGNTLGIPPADAATGVPSYVQAVGTDPRRRGVTIQNPSSTATLRVCATKEDAAEGAGHGVAVPPGVAVTIDTTAPVYVANDDTAASVLVTYFMTLESA